MSFKHVLFTGSLVLWSVMSYFLIRNEVLPFFEYEAPPSYRDILHKEGTPSAELTTVDFLIQEKNIGTNTVLVHPYRGGQYRIESRTRLDLRQAGFTWPDIKISSDTRVNGSYQLDNCAISLLIDSFRIKVFATRHQDKIFLTAHTPFGKFDHEMEFPKDMFLSDLFTPFYGSANLHVGKKWKIQSLGFDFFELKPKPEPLYAQVDSRQKLTWNSAPVDVYQVEVRRKPTDEKPLYTMWIDDEGRVLEQRFRLGQYLCHTVLREKKKISPGEARRLSSPWLPTEEERND